MGKQNSNIEKIFRNKLDNHYVKAPEDVWTNIEAHLNQQARIKRNKAIRYIAAASIAILAVSTAMYSLYKSVPAVSTEINISETTQSKKNINAVDISTDNQIASIINQSSSKEKIETIQSQKPEITLKEENTNTEQELITTIVYDQIARIESKAIILSLEKKNPEFRNTEISKNLISNKLSQSAFLAENNTKQKNKTKGQWYIGGDFAPSYSYRHLSSSGKNQESVAYFNTVENPVSTYTGGLNIQYKAFNRLTIQSGLYYAQMGQSIGNMIIYDNKSYDNAAPAYKENYVSSYTLTNSIGNININSKYVFVDKTNIRINTNSDNRFFFDPSDPSLNELESTVQQNFEYIEVPLLFRFKLIDKKIDLNIIAGAGASFLIGNQVFLITNDTEKNIGKTKNIREINYTGNAGLGIEFPLVNRLIFRLEPSFKYYLNAINAGVEIESHPYSFSVFTGFCLSL